MSDIIYVFTQVLKLLQIMLYCCTVWIKYNVYDMMYY